MQAGVTVKAEKGTHDCSTGHAQLSERSTINGIDVKYAAAVGELLEFTEVGTDIESGREIACKVTEVTTMEGSCSEGPNKHGHTETHFLACVAVKGTISVVGSESSSLVFSMSVKAFLCETFDHYSFEGDSCDSDSISFAVKDPEGVECDIFNSGGQHFGPDDITANEIKLVTLKRPRDCCRADHDPYGINYNSNPWDDDDDDDDDDETDGEHPWEHLEPLLVLLVDACAQVPGPGSQIWRTWSGMVH